MPNDQPFSRETALQGAEASHALLTEQPGPYHCFLPQCPYLVHLPADGVLMAWLKEKTGTSHSSKTHLAYHATALSLRAALQEHGYDLLCNLSDDTRYASFLLITQQWAERRASTSHLTGPIAAATFNHRLATISSLYDYARRMRLYRGDNPIDALARRTVNDQQGARALSMQEVAQRLAQIDRQTEAGCRDYALLSVALETGARVQALAAMQVGHLTWSAERCSIFFPRTKGGGQDERELEPATSSVLAAYLQQVYGTTWHTQSEAPVWISYAHNSTRGQQLSVQALEQICAKRFGTSKFHVTRHTASLTLDDLGVPTSETQAFLRHKNLATTSTYLKRAKRKRSTHGHDLVRVYGIHADHDDGGEHPL